MKRAILSTCLIWLIWQINSLAQTDTTNFDDFSSDNSKKAGKKDFNNYFHFYPIGEDPNISLKTSYVSSETILFEANPNVRLSLYNNFQKQLLNNKKHMFGLYLSASPMPHIL